MIGALKRSEAGRKAEDVARELGVSKHTIYGGRRSVFRGLAVGARLFPIWGRVGVPVILSAPPLTFVPFRFWIVSPRTSSRQTRSRSTYFRT